MSGKNYQEPYEDELDRMRARRQKTRTAPVQQRRRREEEWDDSFEDDEFFIEDLDEEEGEYPNESRGYPKDNGYRRSPRKTNYGAQDYHKNRKQSANRHPSGNRKRKGPVILLLVLCILILSAGALYAKRWMKDRDGYWNIAVFGVDSRDGGLEKGALADVQMIASINKKTGEIRLVSVYRDTYVQINEDGDFHKINEAYFKGGHKQALDTFKRNLDIDVDDYATFNWKAVADAINILGGVDLEITESEFAYINSFITATVESTGIGSFHLEHAGFNHLDGVQAVAYSRLRLMDTDYNRTERQRKVVSLALDKAKQADFQTLSSLAGVVLSEISTSIGIEDIIPLAKSVNRYYLGQTGGFPFAKTTAMVGKLDCVIPMTLESNVIFLHQFLFDKEGYQPSGSVKKISGIISERTGIYEEGKSAGADKNLGGTTGSSGKSGQGGSSSGNSDNASRQENPPDTPADEAPAVTEAEKEEEEESSEDSAESTIQETEKETAKETEKEETESSAPAIVEPLAPDETTLSPEQIQEGPGAVSPREPEGDNSVNAVKPTAPPAPEVGPGFEDTN